MICSRTTLHIITLTPGSICIDDLEEYCTAHGITLDKKAYLERYVIIDNDHNMGHGQKIAIIKGLNMVNSVHFFKQSLRAAALPHLKLHRGFTPSTPYPISNTTPCQDR